jgi:phosphate transport system substrate-binding protein
MQSMIRFHSKGLRPTFAAVTLALVAAACGGSASGNAGSGEDLSGNLRISGSSTVQPITSLVAEEFQGLNPNVSISVDGPGTSDGFALFCEGKIPVSDASRAIEPEEVAACKKAGIDFIELKVAIDGLTVMTNPANDAVDCVANQDLYALIGPESKGFEQWSDANQLAQKVDAKAAPYPDAPLDIVGPGEESGTWGSFIDLVIAPIAEERGLPEDEAETTRPDYQASANDNVIIQGIEGSDTSLGWVGFAYAQEAGEGVKELEIADESGNCVPPTSETIADRSYPLSRDLYIYVNAADAKDDAVKGFVDYYLGDGYAAVEQVGYVSQSDDVLSETVSTWEQRTTGTQEG